MTMVLRIITYLQPQRWYDEQSRASGHCTGRWSWYAPPAILGGAPEAAPPDLQQADHAVSDRGDVCVRHLRYLYCGWAEWRADPQVLWRWTSFWPTDQLYRGSRAGWHRRLAGAGRALGGWAVRGVLG